MFCSKTSRGALTLHTGDESPRNRCCCPAQKFQSNRKRVIRQGLAVGDSRTRPKLAFAG